MSPANFKRPTVIAAAAALILAAAAGWLLAKGDGDDDQVIPPRGPVSPRAVTARDLASLARRLDYPVYWLGALPSTRYELTLTPLGRVYVRYLQPDAQIGDRRATATTVATYPTRGGYAALKTAATRDKLPVRRLADGGIMLHSGRTPRSVYVSYPGAVYQIEVFDPVPGRARRLVLAGRLAPVAR